MVKLAKMPAKDIIDHLAESIDFYEQGGQVIARRMPEVIDSAITLFQRITQFIFTYIINAATLSGIEVKAACYSIAQGSTWTWRDAYLAAYYGGLITQNGIPHVPSINSHVVNKGVATVRAGYEWLEGVPLRLELWTDVECIVTFHMVFYAPERRRKMVKRRGILQSCGWRINMFGNIIHRQDQLGIPLDVHHANFPEATGHNCAYWYATFNMSDTAPFPSFSQSPLFKSCRFPGRPELPQNFYLCPPYGAVPVMPGYEAGLIDPGEPYPCVPNPEVPPP